MTDSASTGTIGVRETTIFAYWLYPVIGIPFVILGLWGGFSPAFQTGAASAFMCGAIVAALGECAIDNYKGRFARFKAARGKERFGGFLALALAVIFFFWNMYYAVADHKTAGHPGVDSAQVTVFLVAAAFLPQARFAFTDSRTPTLREFALWYLALLTWLLKIVARAGGHAAPAPEVVQADVPEVQVDAPVAPSSTP
jgi:hypothetical protein